MLKPHHRGRAPVPHGGGGIGGNDPALASVSQDPTAVGRDWEKLPEPEREQSHGRGCFAEASAVAVAAEAAIDGKSGDKKGGARASPWRNCGGGRLLGVVREFSVAEDGGHYGQCSSGAPQPQPQVRGRDKGEPATEQRRSDSALPQQRPGETRNRATLSKGGNAQ
jgi:hypothetical protein